jgi:hypothetical protein
MLARIAPQAPKPPVEKEQNHPEQAFVRSNASPTPKPMNGSRPLAPPRNDGKSVTDEGKAELRNLLSSLTGGLKQSGPASVPPQAPPVQQTPPHSAPRVSTGITPPPLLDDDEYAERRLAPKMTEGSTAPPELSEHELSAMLRVDKPNLE